MDSNEYPQHTKTMKKCNNVDEDKFAPKHRIFCPSSNKPKLLFSTKKKALKYIEFNADKIEEQNGYAPIRAYWCSSCGGWHVTSQNTRQQQRFDLEVELLKDCEKYFF